MGVCAYGAARGSRSRSPPAGSRRSPMVSPLDKAAGLSVAYGTTLHALKQRAEMKPGESLVVLGASGGVGLAAVEIGKAMGARVIACASSDEKLEFARRYGAAETINTRTTICAPASRRSRPRASTSSTIRSAARSTEAGAAFARLERTASGDRLRVGRDPHARRSTSPCSRAATSAASIGASSPPASRRRIATTWLS